MNIGSKIKAVYDSLPKQQGVTWLAEKLNCDTRTVYRIFKRDNIDIILLKQLSTVLDHDFFLDLSKQWRAKKYS